MKFKNFPAHNWHVPCMHCLLIKLGYHPPKFGFLWLTNQTVTNMSLSTFLELTSSACAYTHNIHIIYTHVIHMIYRYLQYFTERPIFHFFSLPKVMVFHCFTHFPIGKSTAIKKTAPFSIRKFRPRAAPMEAPRLWAQRRKEPGPDASRSRRAARRDATPAAVGCILLAVYVLCTYIYIYIIYIYIYILCIYKYVYTIHIYIYIIYHTYIYIYIYLFILEYNNIYIYDIVLRLSLVFPHGRW